MKHVVPLDRIRASEEGCRRNLHCLWIEGDSRLVLFIAHGDVENTLVPLGEGQEFADEFEVPFFQRQRHARCHHHGTTFGAHLEGVRDLLFLFPGEVDEIEKRDEKQYQNEDAEHLDPDREVPEQLNHGIGWMAPIVCGESRPEWASESGSPCVRSPSHRSRAL